MAKSRYLCWIWYITLSAMTKSSDNRYLLEQGETSKLGALLFIQVHLFYLVHPTHPYLFPPLFIDNLPANSTHIGKVTLPRLEGLFHICQLTSMVLSMSYVHIKVMLLPWLQQKDQHLATSSFRIIEGHPLLLTRQLNLHNLHSKHQRIKICLWLQDLNENPPGPPVWLLSSTVGKKVWVWFPKSWSSLFLLF